MCKYNETFLIQISVVPLLLFELITFLLSLTQNKSIVV